MKPLNYVISCLFKRLLSLCVLLALATPVVALELKGNLSQGGMLVGQTDAGSRVKLMGHSVRVDENGLFVFGLGRDAPKEITLVVQTPNDKATTYTYGVKQRVYPEQRVEGVPQKTVTPPTDVLDRIRQEAAMVKTARAEDSPLREFLSFTKPLEGPITGVYGSRRVYNGTPGRPHYGLDIAAPKGTDVFAPAAGVVKLTHSDMFYSGGTLIIDHGHGVSSTFIHLSKILVDIGQQVKTGDVIAKVGASGRATGPHLDWRINWFDVRLDPELILQSFPAAESKTRR